MVFSISNDYIKTLADGSVVLDITNLQNQYGARERVIPTLSWLINAYTRKKLNSSDDFIFADENGAVKVFESNDNYYLRFIQEKIVGKTIEDLKTEIDFTKILQQPDIARDGYFDKIDHRPDYQEVIDGVHIHEKVNGREFQEDSYYAKALQAIGTQKAQELFKTSLLAAKNEISKFKNTKGKVISNTTASYFYAERSNNKLNLATTVVGNSPVMVFEYDETTKKAQLVFNQWQEGKGTNSASNAFEKNVHNKDTTNIKNLSIDIKPNKKYFSVVCCDGPAESFTQNIGTDDVVVDIEDYKRFAQSIVEKLEISQDVNRLADLISNMGGYDNSTILVKNLSELQEEQAVIMSVFDGMGGEAKSLPGYTLNSSQVASQTCTQTLEAVVRTIKSQTITPTPPPLSETVAEKEKEDNVRADLSTNPDDYTIEDAVCGYNYNPIGESFCESCFAELHETAEAILYKGERIKYSELPDEIKRLITDEKMREKLERLERENDSTSTPVLPKEGDGEDKKLDTDTPENLTTPTPPPAPNLDEPDTTTDKTFKQLADKFVNSLDEKDYEAVANAGRKMQVFDKLSDGTVIYIEPERTGIDVIKNKLNSSDSIDSINDFVRDYNIAIKTTDGNWLYTSNINEGIVFANANGNTTNITGAGYDINDDKRVAGDMQENNMQKGDQQIIDILEGLYKVPSPTINAPPVLGIGR